MPTQREYQIEEQQVPAPQVSAHVRMKRFEDAAQFAADREGLGAFQARSVTEHRCGYATIVYRYERGAVIWHENRGKAKIVRNAEPNNARTESEVIQP